MVYADTTGFILYWKPDQPYYLHRSSHAWFYEYNYPLSSKYNHKPISLKLQQDL